MDDRLITTSKFLSYVLRHNPEALGLTLNPGGWADVDELVQGARAEGRSISRSEIEAVISATEKNRFTLSADGAKIRANYGHSVDVDVNPEPTSPPEHLYHGTARRSLPSIRREGLRPQARQHVHLSATREEAIVVGQRHGRPVVLTIRAAALHDEGHALYESTDAVWLTRRVPVRFITFPDE